MSDPTAHDGNNDQAWFHRHIDPVVDADPIRDAWSDIVARVDGTVSASVSDHRSLGQRVLSIAAVITVLGALAVFVAANRSEDDTSSLRTDQAPPTGLYVPKGLPEGWALRTAWVSPKPKGSKCGVTGRGWQRPTKDYLTPRLQLTYVPCGTPVAGDIETEPGPSLGHGVDVTRISQLETGPATWLLQWEDHGSWRLRSEQGLSEEELVAAARAIVADPSSTAPPIPGMQLTSGELAEGIPNGPTLTVSLTAPDGNRVSYRLNSPGEGPQATALTVDDPEPVDAQPLPVALRAPRWDGVDDVLEASRYFRRGTAYVGTWPGADLQVPRIEPVIDDQGQPPLVTNEARGAYDELLRQLIASLRPATADEWHSFVATATEAPANRLRAADSLDEVIRPRAASTAVTAPSRPSATTTLANGPVTSGPGTSTPNVQQLDSYTELDDLEIHLELDQVSVAAGSPVAGTLVFTNATDRAVDLTECSEGHTRWGLVPADDPDRELRPQFMIDCFATPMVTIPSGATVRYRTSTYDPTHDRWPFAARRDDPTEATGPGVLGTLEAGTYLAVMEIPGRTSTLRLSVPVRVPDPPCRTSDETVTGYVHMTVADARAKAEADGDVLRIVSGPGSEAVLEQDLTCKRVNVDLNQNGVVVDALRY